MEDCGADWRVFDGAATAWFNATSLAQGAALAGGVGEVSRDAAVDLHASGVRVRVDDARIADAVSGAARDLGLSADPAALQSVVVVVESGDPVDVGRFWQPVLGYEAAGEGVLSDPSRRDPALRVRSSSERRRLRNRLHLDVVRPAAAVEELGLGGGAGPYGLRHADPDGNEVDLVPAGGLGESAGTEDWHAVFAAMACYRTTSPAQQRDLAAAVARIADGAGFPLLIDLRPGLVVIDTGKDRWEPDAHGLDVDFADLAADVQAAARDLGATADPALPRFVQLFLDAADVAAVRAFWVAALGYEHDRRTGLDDIHDPRRLSPTLAFQELDVTDLDRRRQRNRVHLELAVPSDVAQQRVETCVAAGGRVVEDARDRWRITDPEGNELVVVSGT